MGIKKQKEFADPSNSQDLRIYAALGVIVTLVLTFPGFLCWDSIIQLSQARSGIFSDLHPPMMAFLWRMVELVITGPFGMLLIQVVTIWTGLFFVQRFYLDRSRSIIKTIMPMLVVFSPPVFGILGLVSKDIQMTAWLILATGLAARTIQKHVTTETIPPLSFTLFWIALWLALTLRHNAIGAALGIVWFLVFSLFFCNKGLFRRLLFTFCIALSSTIVLFVLAVSANRLITSVKLHPWVQIAVFDIVGTAAYAEDSDYVKHMHLSSLGGILRRPDLTTDELIESYRPYDWSMSFKEGPLVNLWTYIPNESERDALIKTWLRVVRTYPSAYLFHRLAVFREALGLGDHRSSGIYYSDWNNFADKAAALNIHHEATLSSLQSAVYLVLRGLQRYTPLFRPYIYGLISILCLIFGAVFLIRGMSSLPFFLALSGLGSELTVFVAAPTFEYRYSYWMIFSSILSLILLFIQIKSQGYTIQSEPLTSNKTSGLE